MTKSLDSILSQQAINEVDNWIAKYPSEQKQSAVMSALMIAQDEKGYITTEIMDAVADYLAMPKIAVYEVATFYSMYEHKPAGQHGIHVCTNISCKLRGAYHILAKLKEKLGVEVGQVSKDGRFLLREAECLGACAGAPMMRVDKQYYENLDDEKLDAILDEYK